MKSLVSARQLQRMPRYKAPIYRRKHLSLHQPLNRQFLQRLKGVHRVESLVMAISADPVATEARPDTVHL